MSPSQSFPDIISTLDPPAIEPRHIFLTGKLFQEFLCDQWATSEQEQLHFIMFNQNSIHGEVYVGLADAVAANVNVDPESLGQRIILPSSFQEAHVICRMLWLSITPIKVVISFSP